MGDPFAIQNDPDYKRPEPNSKVLTDREHADYYTACYERHRANWPHNRVLEWRDPRVIEAGVRMREEKYK